MEGREGAIGHEETVVVGSPNRQPTPHDPTEVSNQLWDEKHKESFPLFDAVTKTKLEYTETRDALANLYIRLQALQSDAKELDQKINSLRMSNDTSASESILKIKKNTDEHIAEIKNELASFIDPTVIDQTIHKLQSYQDSFNKRLQRCESYFNDEQLTEPQQNLFKMYYGENEDEIYLLDELIKFCKQTKKDAEQKPEIISEQALSVPKINSHASLPRQIAKKISDVFSRRKAA
jgi:chromosome segregation ATPase